MERRKATQTYFAFLDFTDFKPISLDDFDFHIHFSQKIFKTEEAEWVVRLSLTEYADISERKRKDLEVF